MSKRKAAGKPRLSVESIAAAALGLADSEGFEAVSMRRVADAMGVGTMSLYYYVKTKDDLIAAMDDALMGEVLLPSLPKSWRRAMMEIARKTSEMYARHPWAAVAMISAAPGVNAMRHMEQCLEALADTGLTVRAKLTLLMTIDDFVYGHALRSNAGNFIVDRTFAKTQIATGAFPRLREAFVDAEASPNSDRFERGVNALLEAANVGTSAEDRPRRAARGRNDTA